MIQSHRHGRPDKPLAGVRRELAGSDLPTPRIRLGAKAMLWAGDEVLLVRERRADGSTFWTLPGGGIVTGESPADCLRREVAEELDCRVTLQRPVTTCRYRHSSNPGLTTVYVVFAGRLTDPPVPVCREGVIDARWIAPEDPPGTTLAPFRRALQWVGTRNHPARVD